MLGNHLRKMPKTDIGNRRDIWWDYFENEAKTIPTPVAVALLPYEARYRKFRLDALVMEFGRRVDAATQNACRTILRAAGCRQYRFLRGVREILERFPSLTRAEAQAVFMNGLEDIIADLQKKNPGSSWEEMAAIYQKKASPPKRQRKAKTSDHMTM